ncbi:armadillo-type protein [Morchella snyderi]|nr:armadillo-type protein [Morchella snyderi]
MASQDPVQSLTAIFKAEEHEGKDLAPVLEMLRALRAGEDKSPEKAEEDIEKLKQAVKACADASREEEWRTPIGEAQILTFFQSVLASNYTDHDIRLHSLRLLGNCCADNDKNRQRVIDNPESLTPILECIKNPDLQQVGLMVLHNICLDYEPSQLKAISDGACPVLLEIIGREGFLEDEELDYFGRVLELLLSHDAGKEACPPSTLKTFLSLAASPLCSFDDQLSLSTLISTLLASSEFQTTLISSDLFPQTLDLFEKSFTPPESDSEKQDAKLIAHARKALLENIGDLSSHNDFRDAYPLSSPVIARVRGWLNETDDEKIDLTVAACLILGNIGRSDEVCGSLVQEYEVHKDLFGIVRRTIKKYNDAKAAALTKKEKAVPVSEGEEKPGAGQGAVAVGVLHAATGVLKNFAIAKTNKVALGSADVFDLIWDMLSMEGVGVGQVWYSAVGLGRLVCVDCIENVTLALQPSPKRDEKTILTRCLEIYDTAEELPTRTEIARTIVAMFRVLNASSTYTSASPELEAKLYTHKITAPLWGMITQDKWPVVRTEGLFGLVIMARGAAESVWMGCGIEEEKALKELKAQDLDNAIILMSEIKKNLGDDADDRVGELLGVLVEKKGSDVAESVARLAI